MAVRHLRSLYQIKVSLVGTKPPIWRRLLVHNTITLGDLHFALQGAMGWMNCHLHQFEKDGVIYGMADDEFDAGFEVEDEAKVKLSKLLIREKDRLAYEYDFGDGWRHNIVLEKILPFSQDAALAECIKGKRACPPEDCGGVWGYESLQEVLNDPDHSEYDDMLAWVGEGFDAEHFNVSEANNNIALIFGHCAAV